jgi:hypothetical protein
MCESKEGRRDSRMEWHQRSKSYRDQDGRKRGSEGGMGENRRERRREGGGGNSEKERGTGKNEDRRVGRKKKEGRPKIQSLQGLEEGKRWRQCARPLWADTVVTAAKDMVLKTLTNAHGREIRFEGGLECCCSQADISSV